MQSMFIASKKQEAEDKRLDCFEYSQPVRRSFSEDWMTYGDDLLHRKDILVPIDIACNLASEELIIDIDR